MRHLMRKCCPRSLIDGDTRGAQVVARVGTALRRDRTRARGEDMDLEALLRRVERRGADADVLGQAADPDPSHAFASQLGREAGFVEGGILILVEPACPW